ncbi:response regulator transcription factor [Noviherbaspirillum suwonense]|uniref:Two component transcriptional regulator, LuxR family n=1 Tax=Noviherbaspirillum suwonense TaxID=1224511 RepID=A0ABY1QT77_9BURK|nr:response regulator transcription factor [Noviherbaspirillum suwonense]SMP77149.1 two component transcriptional regulator, LuxR family [Noviherbaspirillum suwonense]
MIRVLLVDDHVLVRAGINSLLQTIDGVEVVAQASNGAEALQLVAEHRPDVILMDIAMDIMNGLEATAEIQRGFPQTKIVILSMYLNEAYVEQALRAGASGYLLKDSETEEIELALATVASGELYLGPRVRKQLVESYLRRSPDVPNGLSKMPAKASIELTARQREVLKHIAEGWSTKEIAQRLGISPKTVEAHRTQLMERLGIRDIPGLVRYAIRVGLVTLEK